MLSGKLSKRRDFSMKQKERTIRLQVYVSDADLRAIVDFRFRERIPTMSAAIRELLRRGIAKDSE
jgi:hypothetical protein